MPLTYNKVPLKHPKSQTALRIPSLPGVGAWPTVPHANSGHLHQPATGSSPLPQGLLCVGENSAFGMVSGH